MQILMSSFFKDKPHFITGSTLVKGVTPADIDVVVLVDSSEEVQKIFAGIELAKLDLNAGSLVADSRFMSIREGDINYICTFDYELFYRFKAFSGVLNMLQIKDKKQRIALSAACLYWEPEVESQ